jgi:homoserine kinase
MAASDLVGHRAQVSVPATSANLGPGYDSLGLALDLRDVVTAEIVAGALEISVVGEGETTVDRGADHLVYRSLARGFEAVGLDAPAVRLECRNAIPHGRGLGSSSAAIVAGLGLARALVPDGERRLDEDALFRLAAEIEQHPDNVAPAAYGGFTIAYQEGGAFHAARVPVSERIAAVACIPETALETKVARGLIPEVVPHAEAAADAGRAALLVAALCGRVDLLFDATRDWLHQSYREPAMPGTIALVAALREQGLAAVVSGAGPTVLVLGEAGSLPDASALAPAGWRGLALGVSSAGLRREM